MKKNMSNVSIELTSYFRRIGKTQKEISEELNVSDGYVCQLLGGKVPFGKSAATKWHNKYGFSIGWLMSGEGSMFPDQCGTNVNDKGIQINSPVNAGHDVKVQGYIDILDVVKESQRQSSEVLRQTAQMQEILKAMIDKIK